MNCLLITVLALILQCQVDGASRALSKRYEKCNCECGTETDVPQLKREDSINLSVDELINKMHSTVDGNFKMITKTLCSSKCNFSYLRRSLDNLHQSINKMIDIFSCPEQRHDTKLFDNGVDRFTKAIKDMVADMRNASKTLSQECYDLFIKIKRPAFETGESVLFAIQNSKC